MNDWGMRRNFASGYAAGQSKNCSCSFCSGRHNLSACQVSSKSNEKRGLMPSNARFCGTSSLSRYVCGKHIYHRGLIVFICFHRQSPNSFNFHALPKKGKDESTHKMSREEHKRKTIFNANNELRKNSIHRRRQKRFLISFRFLHRINYF